MDGCPCGSGAPLEGCCGRFLDGLQVPARAEELMRSRYTAYALGRVDYLLDTQVEGDREAVERWARQARFVGLEVRFAREEGDRGEVEFVATWRSGPETRRHHERSDFERRDGRWIYVSGRAPRPASRPGRNEPCPCGSGRKFKKCCGAAG